MSDLQTMTEDFKALLDEKLGDVNKEELADNEAFQRKFAELQATKKRQDQHLYVTFRNWTARYFPDNFNPKLEMAQHLYSQYLEHVKNRSDKHLEETPNV